MGYTEGKGVAEFDISFSGTLRDKDVQPHVFLGLLNHNSFTEFESERSCRQREKMLDKSMRVDLDNREIAKVKVPINHTSETIVDFYFYNCDNNYQTAQGSLTLYVKVTWDLNIDGSHISSKEDLLPYYFVAAWIVITVINCLSILRISKFE